MSIHYTDPRIEVPPGVNFLDAEEVRAWIAEARFRSRPARVEGDGTNGRAPWVILSE